jgi:hypothetical protein
VRSSNEHPRRSLHQEALDKPDSCFSIRANPAHTIAKIQKHAPHVSSLYALEEVHPHIVDVDSAVWTTLLLAEYLGEATGDHSGIETVREHLIAVRRWETSRTGSRRHGGHGIATKSSFVDRLVRR